MIRSAQTPHRKPAVYSDAVEAAKATCSECGMLLDDAGEFHPYAFCLWKKAGHDPWDTLNWILTQLGRERVPVTNVRNLPK
jgi:hypothetical protein